VGALSPPQRCQWQPPEQHAQRQPPQQPRVRPQSRPGCQPGATANAPWASQGGGASGGALSSPPTPPAPPPAPPAYPRNPKPSLHGSGSKSGRHSGLAAAGASAPHEARLLSRAPGAAEAPPLARCTRGRPTPDGGPVNVRTHTAGRGSLGAYRWVRLGVEQAGEGEEVGGVGVEVGRVRW